MQEISNIIWRVLVEYIPARDQESAAHHLVNELVDAGIEEEDLYAMCEGNSILTRVVKEVLAVDDIDDDEYEEL